MTARRLHQAKDEDRAARVAPRAASLEPTLEGQIGCGKRRAFALPPRGPLEAGASRRRSRWDRPPRRADRRLRHLRRLDHRDALHLAHRALARTATGQAREQRSQEKQQFQIGSLSKRQRHSVPVAVRLIKMLRSPDVPAAAPVPAAPKTVARTARPID
jgi:hypothetical protein